MKIFFVVRGWPSREKPQLGSFEWDQALALAELGHKVVVLCVDVRFRPCREKVGIKEFEKDDIIIYQLLMHSLVIGKLLKKVSILKYEKMMESFFIKLFNHVIKKEGVPDLIYAHYLPYSAMALAAKRKYNIPVVGMEHWSQLGYKEINIQIRKWAENTYKYLDALLTVSSSLKENIHKNLGVDSIVVNNMISEEFSYIEHPKKDDIVRFVTTGNLLPVKGYDVLVEAFHLANLPQDMWSLDIIGDGKEYKRIVQLIGSCHLENNIHLRGRLDRQGVVEFLRNSDVYILSSYTETFGVSAVEALACGLPVIATKCGGTDDYMTKENGLTCQVGDVAGMSEAIIYMYYHYKDFDKRGISEACQRKFSSRTIALQLNKLFHEIVYNNI